LRLGVALSKGLGFWKQSHYHRSCHHEPRLPAKSKGKYQKLKGRKLFLFYEQKEKAPTFCLLPFEICLLISSITVPVSS
jgi:hypothetical protein